MRIFRTSNLGDSISSNPERTALRRKGEKSHYIEICNKRQVVWTSKVFLWIKENQISQVKEFSAFLCLGRCKNLGPLKSFISYASQLLGPVPCAFSHPEFFRAPCREWLQPDGWQITGILLLPECLEGWNHWWLWHPCLLIWQEIFHFSRLCPQTPLLAVPTNSKLLYHNPHANLTKSQFKILFTLDFRAQ